MNAPHDSIFSKMSILSILSKSNRKGFTILELASVLAILLLIIGATTGAFLGWQAVLFVLIVGSLAGSVVGVTLILLKKTELQGRIPFGPYLSLGALIWVFWGQRILDGYIDIFLPAM